jgi:peptidyl-dipeptidase A
MMSNLKKLLTVFVLLCLTVILFNGCKSKKESMEQQFKIFLTEFNAKMIPLTKEAYLAYWNSQISGKPEDFKKADDLQIKMNVIFADKDAFKKLKEFKESNQIKDELLNRELIVLYNQYLSNQTDTALLNSITKLQTQIVQKYNNYRAIVGKDTFTDNQVEETLKSSTDSKKLKDVWNAHKKIGPLVSEDIIKLVKLRNELAKKLGFNNYHEMSLKLNEQDPEDILKTFNELDSLTSGSFTELKSQMDDYFAKRYKIKKEELMPWHYQNRFFQEAPKIYSVDLDKYYKDKDIVKLTEDYYSGIGLDITGMLKKSDLFEKKGKCQHAFCINIDREKIDTRVLCNVTKSENWMNTMLHEFGHAVYEKYYDTSLPWILKSPAHTFTTEAIAQMFGKFSSNPQWMYDMKLMDEKEKAKVADESFKSIRLQMMVFSRWSQVMYRFEKSLYENPDQDLNKLWWDLVEKYQLLKRPEGRNEPDWASKIHIASSPCYYHNYLLGELLASQLYYYIGTNILKVKDVTNQSFVNKPEVGKYLVEKVFSVGARYYWNDMIEKATGEKLTAKYYALQFVDQK